METLTGFCKVSGSSYSVGCRATYGWFWNSSEGKAEEKPFHWEYTDYDPSRVETVDASPEEKEAFTVWLAAKEAHDANVSFAEKEFTFFQTVKVGEEVRVKKGRMKNTGKTGAFVKSGVSGYGEWVLVREENGETFFSKIEYLEVLHPAFDEVWIPAKL